MYRGFVMGCRILAPVGRVGVVVIFAWSVSIAHAGDSAVDSASTVDAAGTMELAHLQSQFQTIANRVAPAVVAISATFSSNDADDALRPDQINGEKLEEMLDRTTRTVGTGFVIDPDGYILTNEHVIGDASQIWITTDDHKVYPAIVIGSDPRGDLAVLKIPAHQMPTVHFASADSIHRGMWTIAMGNPYGLAGAGEISMSVGIVSATDRSLSKLASKENRIYSNLIQTTAEINPGNSGGPLFDLDGNVIGVNTAVIMPQKSTNGIGFALPINGELLAKVDALKAGREVVYAYLGAMVLTPTPRQRIDANVSDGVLVDSVDKDSPAISALKSGDFVLKIDDQTVRNSDEFVRTIGTCSIAHPTKLIVRRAGQTLTMNIQLRRRDVPSVAINRGNQRIRWRGMLLGPTPENSDRGLEVFKIDPNSPFTKQGISNGVVITSVAGKMLHNVIDLQDILSQTPAEKCNLQILPQPSAKDALVNR
jgi:serine protease Do